MCVGLVLLANSAASNKIIDKDREARPPEVVFHDSLSMESPEVTREGG